MRRCKITKCKQHKDDRCCLDCQEKCSGRCLGTVCTFIIEAEEEAPEE